MVSKFIVAGSSFVYNMYLYVFLFPKSLGDGKSDDNHSSS